MIQIAEGNQILEVNQVKKSEIRIPQTVLREIATVRQMSKQLGAANLVLSEESQKWQQQSEESKLANTLSELNVSVYTGGVSSEIQARNAQGKILGEHKNNTP